MTLNFCPHFVIAPLRGCEKTNLIGTLRQLLRKAAFPAANTAETEGNLFGG
jgi:hypothetical protein